TASRLAPQTLQNFISSLWFVPQRGHNIRKLLIQKGSRGIRQLYDLGSCYPITELVSFTVQPCKQFRQKLSLTTGSSSPSGQVVWARSIKLTTTSCNAWSR